MKICAQCKTELPDAARFCLSCGQPQGAAVSGDAQSGGVRLESQQATIQGDLAGHNVLKAQGDLVQGDKIEIVVDEERLCRLLGRASSPQDMRQAIQRYLQCMVDRYRYLDFKGMGVSDRVPLRSALAPLRSPPPLPRDS